MLFNSYLFVLVFLPLSVLGYFALNRLKHYRAAEVFLLGMSLWFYGYAGRRALFLLLAGILINYGIYRLFLLMHRQTGAWAKIAKKLLLALAVGGNLGILLLFKYYSFFIENANLLLKTDFSARTFLLPLGISFLTFGQLSFVIDAYRNEVVPCSLLEYAVFISFFPKISSGPITTNRQFLPLLQEEERKRVDWGSLSEGMYLFGMGLGKKVLLADVFGAAANWGYADAAALNAPSAWLVSLCFTLQLYFDFSGYSDMAVGIGKMFRLDLPVNFNSPYQAHTIEEFWDRWHISLTRFFTKYLYIPLGGSRKGRRRTFLNIGIVFLCSGLWHGAGWNFVLWGALHGCFMVFTRANREKMEKIPRLPGQLLTFTFVNLAWVLFRAETPGQAGAMFAALFAGGFGKLPAELIACLRIPYLHSLLGTRVPAGVEAACLVGTVLLVVLAGKNTAARAAKEPYGIGKALAAAAVAALSLLSFSNVSTFLYFNF